MKKNSVVPNLKSEKGMATLEVIPLLFLFVFLLAYALGSFGIIHTGIKYSIGARTYAFETFRNRTSLVYFRDRSSPTRAHYKTNGNRYHGIQAIGTYLGQDFRASLRAIRMGVKIEPSAGSNDPQLHNSKIFESEELVEGKRNTQVDTSPVWIMVQYGICLNKTCGG